MSEFYELEYKLRRLMRREDTGTCDFRKSMNFWGNRGEREIQEEGERDKSVV